MVVVGLIALVFGVLWLSSWAGVPLFVVLSAALAGAGIWLAVTQTNPPRPPWLIGASVVLAGILAFAAPTVRAVHPLNVDDLVPSYTYTIGSLDIDLRNLQAPAVSTTVAVAASVESGDVTVWLPPADSKVSMTVTARVTTGRVMRPGNGTSTMAASVTYPQNPANLQLRLDVHVGLGSVWIRQT